MSEVRLGIDVACRADHRASLADERGDFIWSSWKFRTTTTDLERLWAKIPAGASVTVILEPTRNAWVPLSAWLQARGATVILVPPEQSADLRDYYNKHTKTDRLDSKVLARLPLLHPEGLRGIDNLGPAGSLRRAVRHRFSLVKRRSAASLRLDALVELLGPGWADSLGSATASKTALVILEKYADPRALKRLGRARLAALLIRSSSGLWREDKADELLAMANETLELWSCGGIDFTELAHDIASEVRVLRQLDDEIAAADKRIAVLYDEADPMASFAPRRGSDPSSRRPSWATRAISTASPTSPACAPSPALCPRSTSPDWWRRTRASPRPVTPACATPSTWQPITLGTSTRRWPSATTDWLWSRASTTTQRCAQSRRSSSPGSPPVGARTSSTNCGMKTAKRSPRPKAKLSAPTASRLTPKSELPVVGTHQQESSKTGWRVEAERSRPKRSLRPPTRQEKKLAKMWPEGLDCR
jgi:transposase